MGKGVVSPRALSPNLVDDFDVLLSPCGNGNRLRPHRGLQNRGLRPPTGFWPCAAIRPSANKAEGHVAACRASRTASCRTAT
jgi:hypothetical protein